MTAEERIQALLGPASYRPLSNEEIALVVAIASTTREAALREALKKLDEALDQVAGDPHHDPSHLAHFHCARREILSLISQPAPAQPSREAFEAMRAEIERLTGALTEAEHWRDEWHEMETKMEARAEAAERKLAEADAVMAFECHPTDEYVPAGRTLHTRHIREALDRHKARLAPTPSREAPGLKCAIDIANERIATIRHFGGDSGPAEMVRNRLIDALALADKPEPAP